MLSGADTAALWALVERDPVANIFLAAHLESTGTAAPTTMGGQILGYERRGALTAACWTGANVVPIAADEEAAGAFGGYLTGSGRRFSSIFGPREPVLRLWDVMSTERPSPFDVRDTQPLLVHDGQPSVAANPGLRFSHQDDLPALLPACIAMFEEEVGYSPVLGGEHFYRQRVSGLVRRGHSLIDTDRRGRVIFKAELGAVTDSTSQVQGVWMNPLYRGRGLAAGYMAATVNLARRLTPSVSLYVNNYNGRALSVYRRVGFRRCGTFATILF